ncbi:glycosyltransferase [Shewanella sp. CAL98-MNA-CIBAN-0140]|uniref:glycosyltransferase n=1 Tax=Shewanella sp. CAL98-MNA-CIBAN-0140 TaxID=3140462 RepID=UPI00331726ED
MSKYKISIIMPNYNGELFLDRAIKAFLNSTWDNKELIIVDGKSSDSSHSIISSYLHDNECITWIKESDKGISDAINMGIKSASGDIIGYLGSDDLLLKNTLEIVADNYALVGFDAVYFDSYTHDYKNNLTNYRSCPDLSFTKYNLLKYGTIVGLQNIYFNAEVLKDYSYCTSNKYSMDYELYFRVLDKYNHFLHVREPSSVNIAHNNISSVLSVQQRKEAFIVAKKNVTNFMSFKSLYLNKRFFIDFIKNSYHKLK